MLTQDTNLCGSNGLADEMREPISGRLSFSSWITMKKKPNSGVQFGYDRRCIIRT
ncbi:MAG: hypothetical protein HY514_02105 [Candidatus Aenigmarchaeota archaeon]|nr:hypothetical protein [Candidatus Aenigmarchaeota archaeon]